MVIAAPPQSGLDSLFAVLPVSRSASKIGLQLPIALFSLFVTLTLSGTATAVSVYTSSGLRETIGACCMVVLVSILGNTFSFSLAATARACLLRVFHLPLRYANALAGTVAGGLGAYLWGTRIISFSETGSSPGPWLFNDAAALVLVSGPSAPACLSLACWTLGPVLLWLLASGYGGESTQHRSSTLLQGWAPPRGTTGAAAWLDTVLLARSPDTLVLLFCIAGGELGIWRLSQYPLLSFLNQFLYPLLVASPTLLALYAVGRTRHMHWIGRSVTGCARWWVLPKALTYAVVSLTLSGLIVAASALLFGASSLPVALTDLLPFVLVFLAGSLLAGSLVPFSEDVPLSTAGAGMISTLLSGVASYVLVKLGDTGGSLFLVALTAMVFCFFCWLYSRSASLHPWTSG